MARGFRRVVSVFIEQTLSSNLSAKSLVNDLRKIDEAGEESKIQEFICWLDNIVLRLNPNKNGKIELTSIFIRFIFKQKTDLVIRKICEYMPERFSFSDIKDQIENFW